MADLNIDGVVAEYTLLGLCTTRGEMIKPQNNVCIMGNAAGPSGGAGWAYEGINQLQALWAPKGGRFLAGFLDAHPLGIAYIPAMEGRRGGYTGNAYARNGTSYLRPMMASAQAQWLKVRGRGAGAAHPARCPASVWDRNASAARVHVFIHSCIHAFYAPARRSTR